MQTKTLAASGHIGMEWKPRRTTQPIARALLVFLLLTMSVSLLHAGPFQAIQGSLDLSHWNPDTDGPIELTGEWEFLFGELLAPGSPRAVGPVDPAKERHFMQVPAFWNGYNLGGKILGADGAATYRLHITGAPEGRILGLHIADIVSSYRLYVNGKEVASSGSPGLTKEETVPLWLPAVAYFQADSSELDLVLHVANFHHRQPGIWAFFTLGSGEAISASRDRSLAYDLFLGGSLFVMALYHLVLFALRPRDRSTLYFGLFCLIVTLRALLVNERILVELIPSISFELQLKLEYFTLTLGIPAFSGYLRNLFPGIVHRRSFLLTDALSFLNAFIVLVTPGRIFSYISVPQQIVIAITVALVLYWIIVALIRHQPGALAALTGAAFMGACVMNDIFYFQGYYQSIVLTPAGLLVFAFSQSFILSLLSARTFESVELLSTDLAQLSTDLARTNESYSRFVPREFLNQLMKSDIREIALGDHVERNMTILFADIRSFTVFSETMTPQENFNFLNGYLGRMGPIIRECGGFVDKFIGDAIMALFPGSPDGAVRAAVLMQQAVRTYNEEPGRAGTDPLRIGIGLHTGLLALGTVGERDRMDGTVISDSVNLASRLQDLTKKFRADIILSQTTAEGLEHPSSFHLRYLGTVRVKGKSEQTRVHEAMVGDREIEMREKTRSSFETAVSAFHGGKYRSALDGFVDVTQQDPSDGTALFYLQQSGRRLVEDMDTTKDTSTPALPWTSSLETTIPAIDEQHRELVSILNRLSGLRKGEQNAEAILSALQRLQVYIVTHFAFEEALMLRSGYSDYEGHCAAHRAFSAKMHVYEERMAQGGTGMQDDLIEFLSRWLSEHIQAVDRGYVECVNAADRS